MKNLTYVVAAFLLLSCGSNQTKKERVDDKNTVFEDKNGRVNTVNSGEYFENEEADKWNTTGVYAIEDGDYDIARESFLKGLKIEPQNVTLNNNLGLVEMDTKNFDEAERYFQKAIELDSTYFKSYTNYSLLLYKMEEYERGVDMANYVIQNCEDDRRLLGAYLNATFSLIQLGECDQAHEYYEEIEKLSEGTDVYDDQKRRLKQRMKEQNC